MCLLLFKPSGISINPDHFYEAAIANPDGAGLAFHNGKKVVVMKSPKWRGREIEREMSKLRDYPVILHFRFATHGKINYDNAHPFQLNSGYAAAHNGVICTTPYGPAKRDESDSRHFMRVRVNPTLRVTGTITPDDLAEWADEIGQSNKLALMSNRGEVFIVNEKQGHWFDGVWYSNYSYESYLTRGYTWWDSEFLPEVEGLKWHSVPEACTACSSSASLDQALWFDRTTPLCKDCAEYFESIAR